ncbi:DUF2802 domain-containing protein [Aquitalea sp. S1-19]|nr:DUF2802 domain-containing protein [Aquitalea sp. S1-19]
MDGAGARHAFRRNASSANQQPCTGCLQQGRLTQPRWARQEVEVEIWLLLACLSVAVAALGWQVYRLRSAARVADSHQIELQAQITRLQKDLHSLSARAPQVLAEPPQIAEPLKRRSDPPPSSELSSPYNQAIALARHGLSAGEVAERCGISRSEAELIVSLYRNSSTS